MCGVDSQLSIVLPSVVINECTPAFDFQMLEKVCGATHHVVSNVFGPSSMGFPCARERRYTILIRKDRCADLTLLSPPLFQELISARVVANADVFLRATRSQLTALLNEFGQQRGLAPRVDGQAFCSSILLSPWLRQQLGKYRPDGCVCGLVPKPTAPAASSGSDPLPSEKFLPVFDGSPAALASD